MIKNKLFIAILIVMAISAYKIIPELPFQANLAKVKENVIPKLKQELESKGLVFGSNIFIRIFKESKELELWIRDGNNKFKLFKTYEICKHSGTLGAKLKEGDRQAPEGFYKVSASQMNPKSQFHLSFNIGYPNEYDTIHNRTGSNIMVHGDCVSAGCYAMTDDGIEEIYLLAEAALQKEQEHFNVHIFPFKMTDENLARNKNSEWKSFWDSLKIGYDLFEKDKIPPEVIIKNKQYVAVSAKG